MIDLSPIVRIEYANMAKLNKIRAWARRNNSIVNVSRYARDAYEGKVKVYSPWNEGRDETDRKVAEIKTIIAT
jgi:hypothetical protein